MKKKIYVAGEKWNRLTLVRPTTEKYRGSILWEATCDCGNSTKVVPFNVKCGQKKSCGCLIADTARIQGKKNAIQGRKYDPVITSARRVWQVNYGDCNDFDLFLKLSQDNCYYCNRPPHRTYNAASTAVGKRYTDGYQLEHGDFTYNGMDRIDSSRGHTIDNVVSCCFDCNKAKSALTQDDFLKLVELIYHNLIDHATDMPMVVQRQAG